MQANATCQACGNLFTGSVQRRSLGQNVEPKFCSRRCFFDSRKMPLVACIACGKPTVPVKKKSRSGEIHRKQYCSTLCASGRIGCNNSNWNGGSYVSTDHRSGRQVMKVLLAHQQNGIGAVTMPEHRIIAAKHIGRKLMAHEPMLHLDNNNLNNEPANLFICASRQECTKRVMGTLPWPTQSNLTNYTILTAEPASGLQLSDTHAITDPAAAA